MYKFVYNIIFTRQSYILMSRSPGSHRWLQEHEADPYVKQARLEGYRSRAVYKLKEVDEKIGLFRPGMVVLELGAAPGGWTQYVTEKLKGLGRVVASDCLLMDALPDVVFIQGDICDEAVFAELIHTVGSAGVDVLLSDMAPNMSGVAAIDGPRAIALAELALEVARDVLKPGGVLFMKVFHGTGFDALVKAVRQEFKQVSIRKPLASRSRSRETYLLAKGYSL